MSAEVNSSMPSQQEMAKYINIFMSLPMSPEKEKISNAMVADATKLLTHGMSLYGPYFLMVLFSVSMANINQVLWEGDEKDIKAVIYAVNAILESYGLRRQ